GRNQRTVLSPCTRCIYHNLITKIPPQTKDSEHRCFFTVFRDLCFFIPTSRNN
ncbi:6110_t:CDS:1, partial [Funneliformis geosporum]